MLLIFVLLLAAAAVEGWIRARRARGTSEQLTPAQSIALSSARWVMLAVTLTIPISQVREHARIHMGWQEEARVHASMEADAAARGIRMSPEEIAQEFTRATWRITGRWRGVRSGTLTAGLLALAAGYFLRRSLAPIRGAVLAGLAIAIVSAAGFLLLQRPWNEARKTEEARAIHRHTWVNDPPLGGKALEHRLALREFREHATAEGFLAAGGFLALLLPASAWVRQRRIARRLPLQADPSFRSLRGMALLCLLVTGAWWGIQQIPGTSGTQRAVPPNDIARSRLEWLRRAQEDYRSRDADANGIQDWWVGDVAGFHRRIIRGIPLNLIDAHEAQRDAFPLPVETGPIRMSPLVFPSRSEYRLAVIPRAADGSPYGEDLDGDGQAFESRKGYAYSAYWAGEPGVPTDTLIMNQTGEVWRKGTGNTRVLQWPKDPAAEGWIRWVDGLRRPEYLELLRQKHE